MKKYFLLFVVVALMSIVCSVFAETDNSDTSWTGDSRDDAAAEDFIREWDLNTYIYGESDLPLSLFGMDDTNTEEDGKVRQLIEIHALEDASEKDYNGVWIPFMRYLRSFRDAVPVDDTYKDDFILIYDKRVSIQLMGKLYDKLPYEFSDGAVLSVINGGQRNCVDVSMRLLYDNIMLYTIGWDGEAKAEFFCYLKGGI